MNEKDPSSYSILTYLMVIGLSAWAGLVAYIQKIKKGKMRPFNLAGLVGELVTSSFAGVLTFWLCEFLEVDRLLSAICIAISGHMGSSSLKIIEEILEKKFKNGGLK